MMALRTGKQLEITEAPFGELLRILRGKWSKDILLGTKKLIHPANGRYPHRQLGNLDSEIILEARAIRSPKKMKCNRE